MKIVRILAYQLDLPLKEGSYSFSGGRSIRAYDSTVVRIETDAGSSSTIPPRRATDTGGKRGRIVFFSPPFIKGPSLGLGP